jgi:antitoxin component YwqK of YwqJK toxin-antitoxin module
MRISLIIFVLICNYSFSQNWERQIDSTFHENDSLKSIQNVLIDSDGNEFKDGKFWIFNSEGILISEGEMAYRTFVECQNCFEIKDETAIQYTCAKWAKDQTQVGVWTTYYPNGSIESTGKYSGKVHEMGCSQCTTSGTFSVCDGMLRKIHSKDGVWQYFDVNADLTRSETYLDGLLIYEATYKTE